MATQTNTITCPKCGGEMQVGVMATEHELTVAVHGVCQTCDCHVSNTLSVDATLKDLLANRAYIVGNFRDCVELFAHHNAKWGQV